MNNKKRVLRILITVGICFAIIYICTVVGVANITIGDVNRILLHKLFGYGNIDDLPAGSVVIIWTIRMPRIILGFLSGASLAVCGAGYQGIFKNPMADPFILGVSSGAALGAAIGIVFNFSANFFGFSGITILAFVGSFLAIGLVYGISHVGSKVPVSTLLLSGVAVNSTLSSVMSLIMMLNRNSMDQIMFWTMGSLNGKGWNQIITVLPWVIIGMIVLFMSTSDLDIMLTGEETATQLGVNVEVVKRKILIASSIITAAIISVTGIIGFVGLVVPHVVRLITGPKHRILLPMSLVFGGAFLVICDTIARSITTSELPVGVITAVCGGPFFLYLLRRSKKGDNS